jgi:putative hydrolase of the HAD superfamily
LGIISNGNSYPERLGLDEVISFMAYAQDHGGIEKPDPRLFRVALADAGCAPDEMLHVGDSLENDVAGAAAAGVRSVWLNRNGHAGEATGAECEISKLTGLLDIL